jgi:Fe-S-cluster containining protein
VDKKLPVGCARCGTLGKTCCQTREVMTTAGDRERIAAHTGTRDFWEYKYPCEPSYLEQDNDPNWLAWGFRPDGTRPILRHRPNGDCCFFSAAGCALPMEIRPLICRLYPFTYTERGIDGVSNECPREVIPAGHTILEVLGMKLADAIRWHELLYAELRPKEPCDVNRPDIRSAG